MWLRRPMEESLGTSEGAEPEGEISREPFHMPVQHVNGSDVNYNSSSTSTSNMMVQQDSSSHVCPTHHHHHDTIAADAGVAPVGYVEQACSALQPPGLPGPPGAVLHTGEGENEAPPPAANGLTLHASNQSFSLGNPGENGNVWHTSFSDAPHSQGPHQHHQPLQHHIPGMSAAGDMCASSPVGGMSTEGDMCVSSPVGGQLNSSPTMECGLPANVGFESSCCGIRLGEVQAGGVTGTAVGHDHRGGGGGVENGGVGPAQVPPTIPPGKNSVKKSKARGGKVSPDDGTPSPMGMHKLLEHKHWATVYIKPNTVYKRRPFSSLKQRKRRDLVAVGFSVFHKICDSISSGEPEAFMAAVLDSGHVQKMTKRVRRARDELNTSPVQQQEKEDEQQEQEHHHHQQQQQQEQQQQEQQQQLGQRQQLGQHQEQHQGQQEQQQQQQQQQRQHGQHAQQQQEQQQHGQPQGQQEAGFNVAPAVANGRDHVRAAVAALTSDRELEQSYHHHHQQHHIQHQHQHHQHQHQQHQQQHHHESNGHSQSGHGMALSEAPPQVASTGTEGHHPPIDHPPLGMADVGSYEQAAFLAPSAPLASAEAAADAATVSTAAAAIAAADAAAANDAAVANANAAAVADAAAAVATGTAALNVTTAVASHATSTATPLAATCPDEGGISGHIEEAVSDGFRDVNGDSSAAVAAAVANATAVANANAAAVAHASTTVADASTDAATAMPPAVSCPSDSGIGGHVVDGMRDSIRDGIDDGNAAVTVDAAANATAAASAATANISPPAVACPSDGGVVEAIGNGVGDSIRDSIGHSICGGIGDNIGAGDICYSTAGVDNPINAGFVITSGGDERGGGGGGLPVAHFGDVSGDASGNITGDVSGGHGATMDRTPHASQYNSFLPSPGQLAESNPIPNPIAGAAGVDGGVDSGSVDVINTHGGGAAEPGRGMVTMDVTIEEVNEAEPEREMEAEASAVAAGTAAAGAVTAAVAATEAGGAGVGGMEREGATKAIFPVTTCPDGCAEATVGVVGEMEVAAVTGEQGAVEGLFPPTACPERCVLEACTHKGCDASGRDEGVSRSGANVVSEGGGVAACKMVDDGQGVGVEPGQCGVLSEARCPGEEGLTVTGRKRPRLELSEVHDGHDLVGDGALATEHSTSVSCVGDETFPGEEEGGDIRGIFDDVPCESAHLPSLEMRDSQ